MIRFSQQRSSSSWWVPEAAAEASTLSLLDGGLVVHLAYPGVPAFTHIGTRVVDNLERALSTDCELLGYSEVTVPSIMRDEDLFRGETVGEKFRSKISFLRDRLSGYHMTASPEMFFILGGESLLSYRQIPVKHCYSADFFRQMPQTKSFITCRQLRMFGTIALCQGSADVAESLREVGASIQQGLGRAGLNLEETFAANGSRIEQSYRARDGEALGLSIGYEYGGGTLLPIRYRNAKNANQTVRVASFGLSINRAVYALFDRWRDEKGFNLPAAYRPYDVVIVPCGEAEIELGVELGNALLSRGVRAALDDRAWRPVRDRMAFGQYIGAGQIAIVRGNSIAVFSRRGDRLWEWSSQPGVSDSSHPSALAACLPPGLFEVVGASRFASQ